MTRSTETYTPRYSEPTLRMMLKRTAGDPPTGVRALLPLREMRDPELTVRTNRRAYVLPRQLAMYIVRQLTEALLEEIGREFGGRHHTTMLDAINKVEAMRRTDEALDRTITRLADAVVVQT